MNKNIKLRGVIVGWVGIVALALPLMAFADTTTIRSWPGGLTNYQIYQSTDALPTPQGWNAPASGQTQPTPPSTVPIYVYTWFTTACTNTRVYFPTYQLACDAWVADIANAPCVAPYGSPGGVVTNEALSGSLCTAHYVRNFDGATENISEALSPYSYSCPPGYIITGTSPNYGCGLVSPTLVFKSSDGICVLIHNADGTYSYDNGGGLNGGDPDCNAAWQDAVAAVNDKTRGDACSCDSATPATSSIPEPANSN